MDVSFIQIVLFMLFVLAIFGAKATWSIVIKVPGYIGVGIDSIEGLVISVIVFAAAFFIIAPVMGVVTLFKKFF